MEHQSYEGMLREEGKRFMERIAEARRPTLWLVGRSIGKDSPPVIYGLYRTEERALANCPDYEGVFILPVRPNDEILPRCLPVLMP